jgi:hypothetical protein
MACFELEWVACRYSQFPRIDFNESFAHVVTSVSFQITLIAKIIWDLQLSIVDGETAFFYTVTFKKKST